MRLIKPSFEIIEQGPGIEGIYKQIELAGRTCYKSEDRITPDSAKEFVDRMIKSGHGAMLEHGTIYLDLITSYAWDHYKTIYNKYGCSYVTEETVHNELIVDKYKENKYSLVKTISSEFVPLPDNYARYQEHSFITTNLRVLVENGWLDDLKYICEPTKYHEKRVTIRFICDRGVSHEFVRHRVFSFSQESTRFCNYSLDKFNNEITFIEPCWDINTSCGTMWTSSNGESAKTMFEWSLIQAEKVYFRLLEEGWTPQQARAVLPNALKTELIMTGYISDWKDFFNLRCANSAHPQARELAISLSEKFKELNYI